MLEELENHLIFQLQPFEDFRGCALGDRDVRGGENWFKNSQTAKQVFCESSDPIDVVAVSSLLSGKGKWSSDPRGVCFKGDAAHFQRDCNASKHMGKHTWSKGNQSKSWSMSELSISGTGKGKENEGKSKGLSRATKSENTSAKVTCDGKASEMAQVDTANTSWIHEESSQDNRKVKTNLDTRSVVDTLPSNFSPEGIGDGNFHDWIPDGEAWQFRGYDENGFPRSPEGELMDAYELLNSSASGSASAPASRVAGIACKEQRDFCVKHNGGYMILTRSKIWSGNENSFREIAGRAWKERD